MGRSSKGRQKVEMKKMRNDSNLQVTFSKRRSGLFKKASELCTLCGAEVAIVVFSPGNKVFSFGHPNVEALVDRFLSGNAPQPNGAMQLIEANRNYNVRELNMQVTQVMNALDVEKKRAEELNKLRKESQAQHWFDTPLEELTLEQLEQLQGALKELRKGVHMHGENLMIQNSIEQHPPPPQVPQHQMMAMPQQRYYMGHPGASSSSVPTGGLEHHGASSSYGPPGMGHPGASSSYAPPGGFLPYDPTRDMQVNNNGGFNPMNPNMNGNMVPNPNMNQMIPPLQNGFNNPGYGREYY